MRRAAAIVLAGVLCAGTVGPAVAAPAPPERARQLEQTRDRLDDARSRLGSTRERLERARRAVEDAEQRLASARGELEQVRARLERARAGLRDAVAREQRASRRLADANDRLTERLDAQARRRGRMQSRAVDAYKHGDGLLPGAVLTAGIRGADDLHDVAVTVHTVRSLLDRDAAMVDRARRGTKRALAARSEVSRHRQAAERRAREAGRLRRQVAAMVERQEELVDRVRRQRAARRDALRELEQDHAAVAALVRRLERTIAALEIAATAVLSEPAPDATTDRPAPAWSTALPARGRDWAGRIAGVAERRGVDARLLAALVWTESNFVPTAVSSKGALGLAQLMPGTAARVGVRPLEPLDNLDGGVRYLRTQLRRFGRIDLALAAYNAGPGRVTAAGGRVPDIVETQLYVVRVMERYQRLLRAS